MVRPETSQICLMIGSPRPLYGLFLSWLKKRKNICCEFNSFSELLLEISNSFSFRIILMEPFETLCRVALLKRLFNRISVSSQFRLTRASCSEEETDIF